MRRLVLCLLVAAVQAAPAAAVRQDPAQGDPVGRLLGGLESALGSDRQDAFARLLSPDLAASHAHLLTDIRGGEAGEPVLAAVRERERRRRGADYLVVADLLLSRGRNGRLSTYELGLRPRPAGGDALEIVSVARIASVEGLARLSLDMTQPFDVHDFEFTAPDLVITMASGTAFAASTDSGITALVLHGPGILRFTPSDRAEQDQLRILARRPALETSVDELFIRVNPADVRAHMAAGALVPAKADARAAARAQDMFDRFVTRSYSVNLGDLSAERWSLTPPVGNLAVEFRASRHGWLTYGRSVGDPEDITLFDRDDKRTLALYASPEKIAQRGRFYDEDAGAAYDVLAYDVDATFDPARSSIAGRGRLRLRILRDGTQTLSLRLADSLNISSTTSPELGRLLTLRVTDQTTVLVGLPAALDRGREVTVEVTYSGRLDAEGLGNDTVVAALQDPAPDIRPIVQQPEPRFVYSYRSYWYPQALTKDFAPATLRLTVPPAYEVVATGRRIGPPVNEGLIAGAGDTAPMRTVEFVADRPVRYLACEISRFVSLGRTAVGVPSVSPAADEIAGGLGAAARAPVVALDALATPRRVNTNRGLLARAAKMVKFYASAFGEAPYPSLTLTAVDALLPGGHSPAFFAVVQQPLASSPYTWRSDPLAFDRYPDVLLAHEIAHQWWGQAIGGKNYHDQWLSEGLAQYSALMFVAADRPDLERGLVTRMRESAESLSDSGPIYLGYRLGHIEGLGAPFRAVVYNKSAVVLHMLRRLVGDEPFRRGLQRFYRDWRFRKAGTDDLRAAFEAETGQPMGRFFDRWILGSTLPRLRVMSRIDARALVATVHVEQVGETFDLPLTVLVEYADGRTEDVTLRLHDAVVETQIPLSGPARRVTIRDDLTLAEYLN